MSRQVYFDLNNSGRRVSTTNLDLDLSVNETAVMDSVLNIIMTEKGSRVFNKRDFGSSLNAYLHDPITIFTGIKLYENIEKSILRYEPRVRNLKVTVTPDPNNNTFIIDIFFKIEESENLLEINTTLKKIR